MQTAWWSMVVDAWRRSVGVALPAAGVDGLRLQVGRFGQPAVYIGTVWGAVGNAQGANWDIGAYVTSP